MPHNPPLVSILVPCYNHENYVEETLNSILEDTYEPKEILIIDDGSKDNSKETIQSWIVKNNTKIEIHFESRVNKGLCYTLNELVEKSSGKYLVVLASDDMLCNNTIDDRVRTLESTPSKSVLISDAEMIDGKGNIVYNSILSDFKKRDKHKYLTNEGIMNEILFNFAISGAVVMMNKRIFNRIGKYPHDLEAEDLYFYIRSASINQILFLDKIVSKYRWHGDNTSANNPELSKVVIRTYLRTIIYVPGLLNKLKIIKRIIGMKFLK